MVQTHRLLRKYSYKDVITIAVLIGVSLALVVAKIKILVPKAFDLKNRWETLEQNRQRVQALVSKANFLTNLDQAELESTIEAANRGLPVEIDVVSLINTIEGIASATETTVGSISLQPGKISSESASSEVQSEDLSLNLSFTGSKSGIESIPSYFYKAAPLFSISNIEIKYSNSGIAQIDISLIVHSLALPKMLGDVERPLPEFSSSNKDTLMALAQLEQFEPPILEISFTGESSIKRKNLFSLTESSRQIVSGKAPEATAAAELPEITVVPEASPAGELEMPEMPTEEFSEGS